MVQSITEDTVKLIQAGIVKDPEELEVGIRDFIKGWKEIKIKIPVEVVGIEEAPASMAWKREIFLGKVHAIACNPQLYRVVLIDAQ